MPPFVPGNLPTPVGSHHLVWVCLFYYLQAHTITCIPPTTYKLVSPKELLTLQFSVGWIGDCMQSCHIPAA